VSGAIQFATNREKTDAIAGWQTAWQAMERISLDCSGDESGIATAIQRWINLYLDSGRLMGVAVRKIRKSRNEIA
jgi:hypothetical protein